MELSIYSYRFAEAVLKDARFRKSLKEVFHILENVQIPLLDPSTTAPKGKKVKFRCRSGTFFALPVNQKALNIQLDGMFRGRGWLLQPPVVDCDRTAGPETKLKADYKRERIQVEVQFGNMARWYTDVFKFQLSYSLDEIDVGILIVPTQMFANLIDENIAYYERVLRELPWAKMSLTLPILVIGMQPNSFDEIRACYNRAMKDEPLPEKAKRRQTFDERIRAQPEADADDPVQ